MYLMYVDESGDSGLVNSPTNYFCLSGIIVHESRWRDFLNVLIAFRRTMKSVHGLPVRAEIHASEYIRGSVFGLPRQARLAILRNTIDELAKLNYISITNVVVDKRNKTAPYDVFDSAWGTLFQRFENTMTHGNFPGAFRNDHGLIITDATAGTKLSRMVRRMAVYNYIPSSQNPGTSRNIPIKRLIEDPHGKQSHETLPIQMADVCAYFLQQRFAPNSFIRRQRASNYFDRLRPVLNTAASRFHSLGIVVL
jgi:hypothetical protein